MCIALSCNSPSEGANDISWLCSCNFFLLISLISSAFSGFLYIMEASANSFSFRKSCTSTGVITILSFRFIGLSGSGEFCIFNWDVAQSGDLCWDVRLFSVQGYCYQRNIERVFPEHRVWWRTATQDRARVD